MLSPGAIKLGFGMSICGHVVWEELGLCGLDYSLVDDLVGRRNPVRFMLANPKEGRLSLHTTIHFMVKAIQY